MNGVRIACIAVAVAAFVVLGVAYISLGEYRQGIASILLAAVNGLLLA